MPAPDQVAAARLQLRMLTKLRRPVPRKLREMAEAPMDVLQGSGDVPTPEVPAQVQTGKRIAPEPPPSRAAGTGELVAEAEQRSRRVASGIPRDHREDSMVALAYLHAVQGDLEEAEQR